METLSFFGVLGLIFFWLSPVIFILGIVALCYRRYSDLEHMLIRDVGGIRRRIVPVLEKDHFEFHEWLLTHRAFVGITCIAVSIALYLNLK